MFFVSQQYDDNPDLSKKAIGVDELSGRAYNIIEIILLAVMSFDAVLKLALTTKQSKRTTGIGMKEVVVDCLLVLTAVALFIIEFFTYQPVIKGYLRMRSLFKFPFSYSLLVASFIKKTRVNTHIELPK
mmetsp:Transcript_7726/g.7141  ORF Transcript_7726/g.7141 Transcript_7726/m.7141 type:complete len:129 (+) Transcript_7726:227-613(+)